MPGTGRRWWLLKGLAAVLNGVLLLGFLLFGLMLVHLKPYQFQRLRQTGVIWEMLAVLGPCFAASILNLLAVLGHKIMRSLNAELLVLNAVVAGVCAPVAGYATAFAFVTPPLFPLVVSVLAVPPISAAIVLVLVRRRGSPC